MLKLGAAELRTTIPDPDEVKKIKKNPVYIIVDNVLDTYNIGSIFRLADAVAAEKVILCGASETPPHTRIKKASINTIEWVSWEYALTAVDAINGLRSTINDIQVVGVELDPRSKPYDQIEYTLPVVLVVGHETHGLSEETMAACDVIAEIPMWGVNKSMNVMVSLAIVLFEVMKHLPPRS